MEDPSPNAEVEANLLQGKNLYTSAGTTLQQIKHDLDGLAASLQAAWIGDAYDAYMQKQGQLAKAVQAGGDVLQKGSIEIGKMYDAYMEADEKQREMKKLAETEELFMDVFMIITTIFVVIAPMLAAADVAFEVGMEAIDVAVDVGEVATEVSEVATEVVEDFEIVEVDSIGGVDDPVLVDVPDPAPDPILENPSPKIDDPLNVDPDAPPAPKTEDPAPNPENGGKTDPETPPSKEEELPPAKERNTHDSGIDVGNDGPFDPKTKLDEPPSEKPTETGSGKVLPGKLATADEEATNVDWQQEEPPPPYEELNPTPAYDADVPPPPYEEPRAYGADTPAPASKPYEPLNWPGLVGKPDVPQPPKQIAPQEPITVRMMRHRGGGNGSGSHPYRRSGPPPIVRPIPRRPVPGQPVGPAPIIRPIARRLVPIQPVGPPPIVRPIARRLVPGQPVGPQPPVGPGAPPTVQPFGGHHSAFRPFVPPVGPQPPVGPGGPPAQPTGGGIGSRGGRSINSTNPTVRAQALRREIQNRIVRLHNSYTPNLNNAQSALQNALRSGAPDAQIATFRAAVRAANRSWNDQIARIVYYFRSLRRINPNEPVPPEIVGRV